MFKLNQMDKKDIVYVDEAGIDNREDYGYGVKGKRVPGMKSGKRTERVSWIAAINQEKKFAPLTFVGSCNHVWHESWWENCLLPKLQPGQVIILDNATFHKSVDIEELVAKQECEIWYLPPDSPDLNKIERWWDDIERSIEKAKVLLPENASILQRTLYALLMALYELGGVDPKLRYEGQERLEEILKEKLAADNQEVDTETRANLNQAIQDYKEAESTVQGNLDSAPDDIEVRNVG
ncbi:MAG: IS630 family transposase [Okeania sp. SIO1H6]|nr:IS630 family transposase [Okeania sp. SIO1H4]NET12578.1 IS630 family transposase [Okeania sp. SIO1H6]NET22751.1 IS630 family transposase [Okeania sp. SIO1H5]NET95724.1 IS630 family transposase [Okeania sp. SIO1H2]